MLSKASRTRISFLPVILLLVLSGCQQNTNYEMVSIQNSLHPIVIIYFDQASEKAIGSFPIDRNYYTRILEQIEISDPYMVILKFFLDSYSDSDMELAKRISAYGNVVTQSTTLLEPVVPPDDKVVERISIDIETTGFLEGGNLLLPNPNLQPAFLGLGLVDFKFSKNGEYEDCPLAFSYNQKVIPSLALKVGSLVADSSPIREDGVIKLGAVGLSDQKGNLRINLSEPGNLYQTYSFVDVLEGDPQRFDFSNKIVILFVDNDSIRNIKSRYEEPHNPAEIVADSINTVLLKIE